MTSELTLTLTDWLLLAAIIVIMAMTIGFYASFMLASRKAVVEENRRASATRQLRKNRGETLSVHDRLLHYVTNLLDGTGSSLLPTEMLTIWMLCIVVPPLFCIVFGAFSMAIPVMSLGALIPLLLVKMKKRSADKKFEEMLGVTMPLVASNLRGGLTLRASLVPAATNMGEPIASQFDQLTADMDSGMTVDDAMIAMGERMKSKDAVLLAQAIAAQRESGGNLADVIDSVGETIRERSRMRREISSKTSQARLSARVIAALPVLVLVWVIIANENYRSFYLSPIGILVIGVCGAMIILGYIVAMKMADVKLD